MKYPQVQNAIDVLATVEEADFHMAKRSKCIAGHCNAISQCTLQDLCSDVFMDVAGVSQEIADRVVYPSFNDNFKAIERATVGQAIKMLEILRDTGEVRWDVALGLV